MHAVIFSNGTSAIPESKKEWIRQSNLIVAADNGAKYCEELDILPTAVVGDLDSLDADVLRCYENADVLIMHAKPEKDETDLELAMLFAKEQGATKFYIFGALGGRADMMLTNLMLSMHPKFKMIEMIFYSEKEEISLIHDKKIFEDEVGKTLSLVALQNDAIGVTTEGMEYPLNDETLFYGVPRGVSNRVISKKASVRLRKGILLCILFDK
jgi:thiamine pyrophosphokinase